MADCTGNGANYAGKVTIVRFNNQFCGTDDPRGLTYKPFGSLTGRNFSFNSNMADNTNDDSLGLTAEFVTGATFALSVSGQRTDSDNLKKNQALLKKYHVNEVMAGRQPNCWIQIIQPDLTYYVWCVMADDSDDAPERDMATFEMSFSAASTFDSDSPSAIVEDTP